MALNVPEDHIYTWTLKPNSLLLRWYLFNFADEEVYASDPVKYAKRSKSATTARMNFCKLFWLMVFTVILSPLILVVALIAGVVKMLRAAWPERTRPVKPAKPPKIKKEESVEAVASFFDKVSAWFQRHPSIGTFFGKASVTFLWTVVLALIVGAVWSSAWAILNFTSGFLYGLAVAGGSLGIVAGVMLLGLLIAYLAKNRWFGTFLEWIADGVIGFFCTIGRGFRYVGRFLALRHHMVKYRTCPRVIVK